MNEHNTAYSLYYGTKIFSEMFFKNIDISTDVVL